MYLKDGLFLVGGNMIDTHAHLTKLDYTIEEIKNVINKMKNNIIIVASTNEIDALEVIDLINNYDNVYGVIGIHPTEINNNTSIDFILKYINHPKIIGIGEVGLDYHYEIDKAKQKQIFIEQIKLANKYHKTLVIHSRDATKDVYDLLKKYKNEDTKAVIHCYSSSLEMANEFIKLNCMLGIGGVVTFKNSKTLKEVVKNIDLEYLLLETDSPYLTPEPFRGTKNEPYNIIYVATTIAQIKNISLEKVLEVTTRNAISQFDLNIKV